MVLNLGGIITQRKQASGQALLNKKLPANQSRVSGGNNITIDKIHKLRDLYLLAISDKLNLKRATYDMIEGPNPSIENIKRSMHILTPCNWGLLTFRLGVHRWINHISLTRQDIQLPLPIVCFKSRCRQDSDDSRR